MSQTITSSSIGVGDILVNNQSFARHLRAENLSPKTIYAYYAVQALQVILAALERSDGTRRDLRDQVFTAPGVSVPADRAILGRTCAIDPATGDVNLKDFAMNVVANGKENFYKTVTLT